MITRRTMLTVAGSLFVAGTASAQFTGPSVQGGQSTVASIQNARLGTYHTLEGSIVSHLREDYYGFRDSTGEMRVEISAGRFGGREVGPNNTVRIMGELDQGRSGRYLWVKSLTIVS